MNDPTLLVEAALAPDERERLLVQVAATNPQLRGANVADALDIYYSQDAFLERRERFWEQRGEILSSELARHLGDERSHIAAPLIGCSLIAAELLGQPDEWAMGLAVQAAVGKTDSA